MEAALLSSILSGMLKTMGNKLAPLVMKQYSCIVGVQEDLQELHGLVEEIKCWLETAGDKAIGNAPSLNWLKKLKHVAYDADDLLDEFHLEAEKHDAEDGKHLMFQYLHKKRKSFLFQCKAAHKIKVIRKRFDAIVKHRNEIRAITDTSMVRRPVRYMNKTTVQLLPNVDELLVLGRDNEKQKIISKLVETNDKDKIKVISITGLGGSGKTTLAKLVFNDSKAIKKHFELILWVHVSQEFDAEKLIKKLFEALVVENPGQHALPYMAKRISDKLSRKRFLLVMDDVWTESRILWDEFMVYLKDGAIGSRILLTTRSGKVAEIVGSAYLLGIPLLSAVDSWQLFQRSLITPMRSLESEFVKVGKEIVEKCGGVPLAIKVLAGVLHGKERIEEWVAMRNSSLLDIEGEEETISVFACLRLSYFHLPSHLKQCFTLCSLFPKGYTFIKEQLINQWIAHDMISLEDGVDNLEYIGHKCFNSLVQMSFLQDVDEYGGRVTWKMHDLVHDLARTILGDEISLEPNKARNHTHSYRYFYWTEQRRNLLPKNIFSKARAVHVVVQNQFTFGNALKHANHLRSVTVKPIDGTSVSTTILQAIFLTKHLRYLEVQGLEGEALPESISNILSLEFLYILNSRHLLELPKSIGKLKKLRALNLSGCEMLETLPYSIGDCHMISSLDLSRCYKFEGLPNAIERNKKLRVLRLGFTQIERLPSNITTLENLECLDLPWCRVLVELPESIGNLKKLEVLNVGGCVNLRSMPISIGQLTQLRNLNRFIVRDGEKSAGISMLANLAVISGDLNIDLFSPVGDPDDAQKACLKQKINLQTLELNFFRNEVDPTIEHAVLHVLEPPSGIVGLHIRGYEGVQWARWMLKQVGGGPSQGLCQFSCLTVMTLSGLRNLKHLEGLVGLPCLEYLELRRMPVLESIGGGPFPSLMKFDMEELPSLAEVWMVTTMAGGEGGDRSNYSLDHLAHVKIGSHLSDIIIRKCPKLIVKPYFPPSLERLWLRGSNEELLLSPGKGQRSCLLPCDAVCFGLSNMKELKLWNMETAEASLVPGLGSGNGWELLQHMGALESLELRNCHDLIELPESMQSLRSLQYLCIDGCSAIRMLPEWLGELQSLEVMRIEFCENLSSLPQSIGCLASLQVLHIECCNDALEQLPGCLGELRSLQQLRIVNLQGLTCLPQSMSRLTSLEGLWVNHCRGLTCLPEWIQGLTFLKRLDIFNCRDLKRRCERGKGEDWHLISHIPHVRIK